MSEKSYDRMSLARIIYVIDVLIMFFLIEILFILYETKSDFQGSYMYDKQNLTLAEGSFHKFHMKRPIL